GDGAVGHDEEQQRERREHEGADDRDRGAEGLDQGVLGMQHRQPQDARRAGGAHRSGGAGGAGRGGGHARTLLSEAVSAVSPVRARKASSREAPRTVRSWKGMPPATRPRTKRSESAVKNS